MLRQKAISYLPAPAFSNTINYPNGGNGDIINVLHANIARAVSQTRDIAKHFKGATDLDTSRNIWNFLKKEIKYKKDRYGQQDIKLPSRFVSDGSGDCKSYSLFTAGVLTNLNIPFKIRYTSYSADPTPQHVYIVLDSGIIIDGVWTKFNDQKPYTFKKDYTMKIQTLAGVGCLNCSGSNISGPTVMIGDIGKISLKKAAKKVSSGIKKAASKVQTAAKKTAVVKKAAQIQTKAKNTAVIKKAAQLQSKAKDTKVIKTLSKLQSQVKEGGLKSVALAAPRRAYRTLVSLNFRGWATKLAGNINKSKELWAKAGGSWPELEKSINTGKGKKALFGSKNQQIQQNVEGIGSVMVTVGSLLALAGPLIALFKSITGDDGGAQEVPGAEAADNGGSILDDVLDKVKDVVDSVTGKEKTDTSPGQNSGSGSTPQETETSQGSSNSMVFLGLGAAALYLLTK